MGYNLLEILSRPFTPYRIVTILWLKFWHFLILNQMFLLPEKDKVGALTDTFSGPDWQRALKTKKTDSNF